MTEQNPNYVPVDWASQPHPDDPRSELGNDGLTDDERAAGVAPMFEPPVIGMPTPEELDGTLVVVDGEPVGHLKHTATVHDEEIFKIVDNREDRNIVATLNSLGHTVKIGDSVTHSASGDQLGTVEEIGSALIANTDVPNAICVRWPSPAGIEKNDIVSWHHVDNLTVQR